MSRVTAYAFTFKGLDGADILLASYAGHPILVVNTASLCGYAPQYGGLRLLWARYRDKGLMVLGVPSNGRLKAGFTSATEPNDPRLIAAIEHELAGE
jgi:glutathione peroxidase-family protein